MNGRGATGGQLLIGPLGPFDPGEDTHVLSRPDGRWLVSERATDAALRVSDANPSGKVQAWASPGSPFWSQLGVEVGRAELFSDGLLIAGVAPGEWLALTPGDGETLRTTLHGLGGDVGVVLVDRSAGLAAFRLSGSRSADVLRTLRVPSVVLDSLDDGMVSSAPIMGTRSTIVRDDLLPEELGDVVELDVPLIRSYLLVCDRSAAAALHADVLAAGASWGIEPEGFWSYRSYHRGRVISENV